MVTDLPDYEKKVIVVTIPGEYPGLIDINHKQIKGVTLQTPSVSGCLPISIEHTVLIDHRAILGTALKTPTFANCVPTSIENDAIAYDDANDRFYVDLAKISATDILAVSATDLDIRNLTAADIVTVQAITNALPAGTNAIGKLAANNGVDIGDVDVKSIAVGDNNIGNVDVVTLPTILQSTKHDSKTYKTAVFDASASGNLVAAVAGKVIKLHALTIQAQGTVVVNLNNGAAGTSLMEWSFQAREGAVVPMANAPAYWAITGVNTALYVTLSAAVVVTITAIYSDDDAS
jgi:hypothetical protein